jgi:hypothetical protein
VFVVGEKGSLPFTVYLFSAVGIWHNHIGKTLHPAFGEIVNLLADIPPQVLEDFSLPTRLTSFLIWLFSIFPPG